MRSNDPFVKINPNILFIKGFSDPRYTRDIFLLADTPNR